MTGRVYYNEHDQFAAAWLQKLIDAKLIPDGDIDGRSIINVRPSDLRGYAQAHFFAGIGGWSHALRLANWSDDRPVWTGSCPCQPFSVAGKGKGFDDDRHLWPVFFELIRECRPPVVMGEQVAGSAGYAWFDGVASDLEREGYASRAVDIPACAVDAPHIRQRLYWIAVDDAIRRRHGNAQDEIRARRISSEFPSRANSDMGHADDARLQGHGRSVEQHDAQGRQKPDGRFAATGVGDMADADESERGWWSSDGKRFGDGTHAGWPQDQRDAAGRCEAGNATFWSDAIWLNGADGKTRRVGTDFRLLADGFSAGMGRLRADIQSQALEEVVRYGQETASRPEEALRAVWDRVFSEPAPYGPVGEQTGVCGAEILLAFLRQLYWCCGEGNIPLSGEETFDVAVRIVREQAGYSCPPHQWGSFEQRTSKHTDALQALSWVLAQHAQAAWASYRQENAAHMGLLAHGVPARVGKLRGYGNAIVPPLAAEVIRALMESLEPNARDLADFDAVFGPPEAWK